MKIMILPLATTVDDGPRLLGAVSVARMLSAHLEAIFVRPDPSEAFVYLGMFPGDYDEATRAVRQRIDKQGQADARRSRRRFNALCRKLDLPRERRPGAEVGATAAWRGLMGEPIEVIPDVAKSADLSIFVGRMTPYGRPFESVLEATLSRSGQPVLFLPDHEATLDLSRPLIAWDGSIPATHAISAWLSMQSGAGEASVLHVSEAYRDAPGMDDVVKRLAWHGITARATSRCRRSESVGKDLVASAKAEHRGVIVMGGYGHSRFREVIFGGVTRYVLRNTSVPVLIMH